VLGQIEPGWAAALLQARVALPHHQPGLKWRPIGQVVRKVQQSEGDQVGVFPCLLPFGSTAGLGSLLRSSHYKLDKLLYHRGHLLRHLELMKVPSPDCHPKVDIRSESKRSGELLPPGPKLNTNIGTLQSRSAPIPFHVMTLRKTATNRTSKTKNKANASHNRQEGIAF
jgi:hypothetical protein